MPENFTEIFFKTLLKNSWDIFKDIWWFWLILFIFWLIVTIFPELKDKFLREKKFSGIEAMKDNRQILNSLKGLKPTEFEDYIASLYAKLGYKTERVGQSHDGGIDVVAEKNGVINYIQCKKFITKKVRLSDIRDFYGAISAKLTQGNGIFITTNYFTTEAKKFAEDNMIEAIDGYALLKLVKLVNDEKEIINPMSKEIPQEVDLCPKCGAKLVLRNGKYGDFYGCSGYPKCKFIKKI
jgi:restriction system protein